MAILTTAQLKANMPEGQAGQTSVADIHNIVDTFDARAPALIKPPFRPELYGAKFDTFTNDTAAWSAMFAAIATQGYGEVKMPAGKTLITANTLNMPSNCHINGQGRLASFFLRTGNGPLLRCNGTESWVMANRKWESSLSELSFEGVDTATGPQFQGWFCSQFRMDNVRFDWHGGTAIQLASCWDSQFSNVHIDGCGKIATNSTDNASTVGNEPIQIWGGLPGAAVASDDSNNNLSFFGCHLENTVARGVCILPGTNTNAGSSSHQIRFYGFKYETTPFLGSQYMINIGPNSGNIVFHAAYLALMGQTNNTFATTTRVFRLASNQQFIFTDSMIFLAAGGFVDRVFDCNVLAGWRNRIENVCIDGTMPTSAVIHINNSQNIPWARIYSAWGTNPGLTPTNPVYAAS